MGPGAALGDRWDEIVEQKGGEEGCMVLLLKSRKEGWVSRSFLASGCVGGSD